jgi:hypothetical protein
MTNAIVARKRLISEEYFEAYADAVLDAIDPIIPENMTYPEVKKAINLFREVAIERGLNLERADSWRVPWEVFITAFGKLIVFLE